MGGGAGATAGAGGAGGIDVPQGCGRIDLLQDTFGDGTPVHLWYVNGLGSAAESNGPALSADPGNDYALYRSTRRYDLTGGNITIKLDVVPDFAVSGAEAASFRVEQDNGRFAEFRVNTNGIVAGIWQNSGFIVLNSATAYDPLAHSYLRFGEEDGVLRWLVSPDGMAFSELASTPVASLFPDAKRLRVAAGAIFGVSGPTSESRFDDALGQSTEGDFSWCAIHLLEDDFDDSIRSNDWLNTRGSAVVNVLEAEGELAFTLAPEAGGLREYVSSQAYDLRDDAIVIEVTEVSAPPSTTYFEVRGIESRILLQIVAKTDLTTMEALYEIEAVVDSADEAALSLATLDHDPVAHRWLRIRDDSGALYFEHSADGTDGSWQEIAVRSPNPIPIDDVLVVLGVSTSGAGPTPGQSRFDNLNNAP